MTLVYNCKLGVAILSGLYSAKDFACCIKFIWLFEFITFRLCSCFAVIDIEIEMIANTSSGPDSIFRTSEMLLPRFENLADFTAALFRRWQVFTDITNCVFDNLFEVFPTQQRRILPTVWRFTFYLQEMCEVIEFLTGNNDWVPRSVCMEREAFFTLWLYIFNSITR